MAAKSQALFEVISGRASQRAVLPQITHASLGLSDARGLSLRHARRDPALQAELLWRAHEATQGDGIYCGWEASFTIVARALGVPHDDPESRLPVPVGAALEGKGGMTRLARARVLDDVDVAGQLEVVAALRARDRDVALLTYVPGPFTLAALLMGHQAWRVVLGSDPGLARALLSEAARHSLNYARAKVARGCGIVVIAEPAASASVLALERFRQFVLAPLAAMVAEVRALGAIASVHVCGEATPLLADLVGTGASVLEVDTQVDLPRAVTSFGDRVCWQGNLDPRWLATATADAVSAATHALATSMQHARRFIVSTGCEVPLGTPLANLAAMVRAARC